MSSTPRWLQLGDRLLGPLIRDTSNNLEQFSGLDFHVAQIPALALNHLAHSVQTSIDVNREGRHAIALSLLRQAVEALSLVELGLVDADFSYPLLQKWDRGHIKHGQLRQSLEAHIWPKYGSGLWDEPWSEFFGHLSKAVQPYAHCSPELMQWNISMLTKPKNGEWISGIGRYDAMNASRLTLFHVLVEWTLGRLLSANRPPSKGLVTQNDVCALGSALASSEFLIGEESDWSVQLSPHVFFKE